MSGEKSPRRRVPHAILLLGFMLMIGACATRPPDSQPLAQEAYDRADDPMEPLNRKVFAFNTAFDKMVTKPIAQGYRAVTPLPVRKGVRNAVDNLEEPWTMVNALLQGKMGVFGNALSRFLINSTIGVAGLFDPAQEMGIERHEEDFGQTLAVWGIGGGPYWVVPFFGPSNPRDFVGLATEFFADPRGLAMAAANEQGLQASYLGVRILVAREKALDTYDKLLAESQDPYSAVRSAYRQRREFFIKDGALEAPKSEDDIFGDDDMFDADEEPQTPKKSPQQPAPEEPKAATAPAPDKPKLTAQDLTQDAPSY